jgi:hypothetical protein
MTTPVEAQYGGCAVHSVKMDPPVEVTKDSTVTIRLDYDLSNGPIYKTGGVCDDTTPCTLGGIDLTPTIVQ